MLSTNSLSAFSAATTAPASAHRSSALRLVREPLSANGSAQQNSLPKQIPSIAPPRGSLVNLSV